MCWQQLALNGKLWSSKHTWTRQIHWRQLHIHYSCSSDLEQMYLAGAVPCTVSHARHIVQPQNMWFKKWRDWYHDTSWTGRIDPGPSLSGPTNLALCHASSWFNSSWTDSFWTVRKMLALCRYTLICDKRGIPNTTMWRKWKKRAEVRRLTSFERFICERKPCIWLSHCVDWVEASYNNNFSVNDKNSNGEGSSLINCITNMCLVANICQYM